MAQINVSHYNIRALPDDVMSGIHKLSAEHAQLIKGEAHEGFVSTLQSKDKILGFAYATKQKPDSVRLQYIFIHPACRNNQFGSKLTLKIFQYAHAAGVHLVNFDTNNKNKDIFIKNGFILVKEPTSERHLAQYHFERPDLGFYLEKLAESKADPKRARNIPLNIPSDNHHYKYSTEEAFMSFHRCMLAQAQREISILCDNILNPIFKDHYLRACLLQLSKRNAQAKIKILLEDDRTGAGYHSPIIELAQRLSSFIEIKTIPPGSIKPAEMITCVDFDAGIYRKSYDAFAGFANFHNHLIAQRLRDSFQQQWQYAKPSMQLRRLSI